VYDIVNATSFDLLIVFVARGYAVKGELLKKKMEGTREICLLQVRLDFHGKETANKDVQFPLLLNYFSDSN